MSPLFGWAHGRVLRRRVIERFAFRVEAVLFTLEQPLSAVEPSSRPLRQVCPLWPECMGTGTQWDGVLSGLSHVSRPPLPAHVRRIIQNSQAAYRVP
jgi:hypothetical protein